MTFNDNVKAQFGTSNDLEIFHNGSHSIVKENGTGNLFFQSNGNGFEFQSTSGVRLAAFSTATTGAILYHSDSAKVQTTANGIEVFNTLSFTDSFGGANTISAKMLNTDRGAPAPRRRGAKPPSGPPHRLHHRTGPLLRP